MSEIRRKGREVTAQEMLWNLAMRAEGKDVDLAHGYRLEDNDKTLLCETGCQP